MSNSGKSKPIVDYTQRQLPDYYRKHGDLGKITNNVGNPIAKHDASLTVGRKGPILLQDWQLLDELSHFVRERIPERVVHAKGASASGVFVCTTDISDLTAANVFVGGKTTPIRVRFSTVGGSKGSADTVRDPRGFAVKFYTEDGIWDLVGNNTPIFFIRDPILFPMFIHTQKPNPVTNMRDWNAFWDFLSLRHESTHQVMFLMSDRGIPDGHRHMNGFGSHTFALTTLKGATTYCKFHWITQQGIKNIAPAKAEVLAGQEPDYNVKDLYNAIASGNFPRWKLFIQTMTESEAAASTFNPFDVTKVWPHALHPLRQIGEMTLNKNPDNFFAEVEQLSFCPGSFIPGIGPSPDRMLLGRIFSYHDASLYRLGANFNQFPVNAPFRVNNFERDGIDAIDNQGGAPNYHPNSFGGPHDDVKYAKVYPTEIVNGMIERFDTTNNDNFSQPKVFYHNVLNADERQRMADNIVSGLQYAVKGVQDRTVEMFANVSQDLADKISVGLKATARDLSVAI